MAEAKKISKNKAAEEPAVSIEESFERLEEIIRMLEDPKTGLSDAMKYYTEGVKLLEGSRAVLEGVEQELKILNPEEGETVTRS